jgi:hypothetical protein
MQIRPRIGRRLPATQVSAELLACRGTPSPYPMGTSPSVVACSAIQVWP